MPWMRMTVIIEGSAYTVEQKEKTSPLVITNLDDEHDWIIVKARHNMTPNRKLRVEGKGWVGKNP